MNVISPYTIQYQSSNDAIEVTLRKLQVNKPIRIIQEVSKKIVLSCLQGDRTVWVDGSYRSMLEAQEHIDDFFMCRTKLNPKVIDDFNNKERQFRVIYLNREDIVSAYDTIYDIASNISKELIKTKVLKLDMLNSWAEYWDF